MTSESHEHVMVGPLNADPSVQHLAHRIPGDAAVADQHGTTTYRALCGAYCVPAPGWYLAILPPCAACARDPDVAASAT